MSLSYAEGLGRLNNITTNQDATLSKNIQGTTNATFPPGVDPQIDSWELTGVSLSISGTTFNDRNGDGFKTQDETGLPGWTVILEHDGKEVSITTNDSGRYIFRNLEAGRYTVTENAVAKWSQTSPGAGNYTINLVDKDAINYNFGNILGHNTYAPQKHPIMAKNTWNQRTKAIKNLPKAGISPEGLAGVSYPSSFSLLSHIPYLGNGRDQGNCGNCWVWGCMAPIEVAHDVQNGVLDRLSIQYLNSNYNGGSGNGWACCGGWESGFKNFFSSQGKFIPWSNSNANYQDGWRQCSDGTSVPASSISTTPNYPITSIQWHEIQTVGVGTTQAISNIKSYLYAHKAVTLGFYLPDFQPFWSFWSYNSGNWNPDSYCGLSDGAYPGGHLVTVVGWDDSTDSWIVLNSWGVDSAHPNGTFKLKMDMNYNCANGGYYSYSFGYFDVAFGNANHPPNTPSIPSGPSSGAVGTSYSYSTSASDPDGDQVKYTFDWEDGMTSTTGLVNSGTSASAPHSWDEIGTYDVRARATDSEGATSGWSNSRSVSITNLPIPITDSIGVWRNSNHNFYLDYNLDGILDKIVTLGANGDKPVSGNWNAAGKDGVGVYRDSNHNFYLDYDLDGIVDKVETLGANGDIPVSGNWNAGARDGVGVYRDSNNNFYLDYNLDGILNKIVTLGAIGDKPVSGDWDGDGKDGVGVYRDSNHNFYLDNNLDGIVDKIVTLGATNDLPTAGAWS